MEKNENGADLKSAAENVEKSFLSKRMVAK